MKILCLCDSPTITSGFARVAANLTRRWAKAGAEIDIWGIAFQGWKYRQHPYVHEFFPAGTGNPNEQWCGQERLALFLGQLQLGGYTHVWIMQDTFLLSNWGFPQALRKICTEKKIRSMLYFPVDAPLNPEWTDIIAAVDVPVAYTEYGAREAREKMLLRHERIETHNTFCEMENKPEQKIMVDGLNFGIPVSVAPHGVDTTVYFPIPNREEHRAKFWNKMFAKPTDFLMVNVGVNQRRKDMGRSMELHARLLDLGVPSKLVMHMRAVSDDGLDLTVIGDQLGLHANVDWTHHNQLFINGSAQGRLSEQELNGLYGIADLFLTTTLGEGWGLGITESLAAGTPVAMPDHTACAEIGARVSAGGLSDQVLLLPLEGGYVTYGMDNSRLRPRVDLKKAAEHIQTYYKSGLWKMRRGLTEPIRQWLSWDRVADKMWKLMRGEPVEEKECI